MTDFRRKLFSREASREPPVRFDTAGLPGLYPFATARADCRNGFLRHVNAAASGFAGGRELARAMSPR
jgi:hypothetical protein